MRAKPLPAETRRAVTVEAVIELAAERDPGEITTAAIASHMKLTQGALFRHFPSKDAIWEAVLEWVAERLLARVDRAAAQATSPLAALQAIFLAHADFVAEHPGAPCSSATASASAACSKLARLRARCPRRWTSKRRRRSSSAPCRA